MNAANSDTLSLKKHIYHQLITHASISKDQSLLSGNSGIILLFFEISRQTDNEPLQQYAFNLLGNMLIQALESNFQTSEDQAHPLALGCLITEGYKRNYFDLDVEEYATPFDKFALTTTHEVPELLLQVQYLLNRYLMCKDTENGNASFFLDHVMRTIENIIATCDTPLYKDTCFYWIIYQLLYTHELTNNYLSKLLLLTREQLLTQTMDSNDTYALWRILALLPESNDINGLRDSLFKLFNNASIINISIIQKWGSLRTLFFPQAELMDTFSISCLQSVDLSDLKRITANNILQSNYGLNQGLAAMLTIL